MCFIACFPHSSHRFYFILSYNIFINILLDCSPLYWCGLLSLNDLWTKVFFYWILCFHTKRHKSIQNIQQLTYYIQCSHRVSFVPQNTIDTFPFPLVCCQCSFRWKLKRPLLNLRIRHLTINHLTVHTSVWRSVNRYRNVVS